MAILRKQTAWKKSRKFGDVKGGRVRPKLADGVFNRKHNFLPPSPGQKTPVFFRDNPSRDFYFPVSMKDVEKFLQILPREFTIGLTHVWFRKLSKKEYERQCIHASFIYGGAVQAIVLYPFPRNLRMYFGSSKPSTRSLKWYSNFGPRFGRESGMWYLQWTASQIKQYYLEGLLLHELGHKVDSQFKRYWNRTYSGRAENFADSFAVYWRNRINSSK